jgi:hypothetical protein
VGEQRRKPKNLDVIRLQKGQPWILEKNVKVGEGAICIGDFEEDTTLADEVVNKYLINPHDLGSASRMLDLYKVAQCKSVSPLRGSKRAVKLAIGKYKEAGRVDLTGQ